MSSTTLQQAGQLARQKATFSQDPHKALMSLTALLAEFRQYLEAELAQDGIGGIGECNLNAAALLSDLCKFMGLGPEQRARVLGPSGLAMLGETWKTPSMPEWASPGPFAICRNCGWLFRQASLQQQRGPRNDRAF